MASAGITGATINLPGGSPSEWTGFQILDNSGNVIDGGTFAPLPTLPQVPSITNSMGGNVSSSSILQSPGSQTYAPTPDNPTGASVPPGTASGAQSSSSFGFNSHTAVRILIVILGLVFIAVGLSMFRGPSTIVQTAKGLVPE